MKQKTAQRRHEAASQETVRQLRSESLLQIAVGGGCLRRPGCSSTTVSP